MKKLYSTIVATGLALAISGCSSNSLSIADMEKLDEKKICNIEVNGIAQVLASAEKYNAVAKEHRVEFKRLGMTATEYINGAKKAIETNSQTVPLTNNKKPTKNSVSVSYAAQRACKFAVSALTQKAEGKKTWRAAVPGDGFKY